LVVDDIDMDKDIDNNNICNGIGNNYKDNYIHLEIIKYKMKE
jgi:hypothetical protein